MLIHEIDFLAQVSECIVARALANAVDRSFKIAQQCLVLKQRSYVELLETCTEMIKRLEEVLKRIATYCYGSAAFATITDAATWAASTTVNETGAVTWQ